MSPPWHMFNVTPSGLATCEVLGSGLPLLAGSQWVSALESSSSLPMWYSTSPLLSLSLSFCKKREEGLFLGIPKDSTEAGLVQQGEAEGGRASARAEMLPDLTPTPCSLSGHRGEALTGPFAGQGSRTEVAGVS